MSCDPYIRCSVCGATNREQGDLFACRRCGMPIHADTRYAIHKSWAYLITAIIAYIPANLFPMLVTRKFGQEEGNTIIGGIITLWEHGSYPIAAIIFIASVLIPILKFLILIYLLVSVKYPLGKERRIDKHKLYYLTEIAGPWSMVDVFVVAILVGLIHFSGVRILPGVAATAFALSVLFTLLAAHAFDARLVKDCKQ